MRGMRGLTMGRCGFAECRGLTPITVVVGRHSQLNLEYLMKLSRTILLAILPLLLMTGGCAYGINRTDVALADGVIGHPYRFPMLFRHDE